MNKAEDIVIIGAGPAGVSTSLFLAKAGIPHTLIEKSEFPRDKTCGDALSGKVVYVLKQLGESYVERLQNKPNAFLPSWGVKFVAPNGKHIDIPFKSDLSKESHAPGFISKRIDFDAEFFSWINRDYATVHLNTALESIEGKGKNMVLKLNTQGKHWEIKSPKLVIGAEGDRSIVAKNLSNIRKENDHYCAGIRAYYDGVTGLNEQGFIELHFLPEMLPGYFWIFPLPNGQANVGAGMLSATVSKKRINLKEDMLRAIETNQHIRERFKDAKLLGKIQGWGLPLGSKIRDISGDNFLLTGDAASLIDPFTGEGIGNALYSGMLAARHIENCLTENRFDAVHNKAYDKAFYDRQWDELKLSHTMQKLVKFPWLFNFVVNKAHKNKALRETISCMFEDLDLRAKLRNPLFYLRLLFND